MQGQGAKDVDVAGLVHKLFESQAERTPDAVATIWGDERLTYAELNSKANRIAHSLLSHNVRPEDRVGLYAERSVESVIGMLAILKAGAAYVPLDPMYPAERLEFMCRDSGLAAVLTTATVAERFPEYGRPMIVLDANPAGASYNPDTPRQSSDKLAYVVYTSGSTGRPKGVMVEHRNVVGLIEGRYAPIGPDDCVAHSASPSFDATTWEVWAPLLHGARLLIVPQATVLNASTFNQTLLEHRVTAMWLTVGLFNEYVDALEEAFGQLRYLLTGGDVLIPSIVARALKKPRPPQHLVNVYGPTETTTFATTHDIKAIPETATSIPIGKPIANWEVYILNEDHLAVAPGTKGEIYIGGVGVARGYMNLDSLTEERFVANPFQEGSRRLYRSGDFGRWTTDGKIEFLGRNDSQMKIRGFRIELGEVEAALQSFPAVRHAVAVVREETPGSKRLLGYVVLEPSYVDDGRVSDTDGREEVDRLTVQRLRQYLEDRLPAYMIPAMIVTLEAFPLTPNGKVDRLALPSPDPRQQLSEDYVAPRTALESTLSAIWEATLKVGRVGVQDNFFELGGDSLLGIDTIDRIAETLDVELHFMTLFEYPTVGQLAQFIDSAASRNPDGTTL